MGFTKKQKSVTPVEDINGKFQEIEQNIVEIPWHVIIGMSKFEEKT